MYKMEVGFVFNPFDFAYDEDSKNIYAATSFLLSGAQLYWVAGALNLENYLGKFKY